MAPTVITTTSAEETMEQARQFGAGLTGGVILLFYGDLGSGKTTFIRGMAEGMGIDDPAGVSSPSYTLMDIHSGPLRLVHVDLYRLSSKEDVEDLALAEVMDNQTVMAIEWSERLTIDLGYPVKEVYLTHIDDTRREIRLPE
jgi:tRNA threonylcarbamoyladenosine biosynthesis protein TsaE